jgi:hypothetical protein
MAIFISSEPIDCTRNKAALDSLLFTIDYNDKNMGNPKLSTVKPSELSQMKSDYNLAKKQYDALDCSKNTERSKCFDLQTSIETTNNSKLYALKTGDVQQAQVLQNQLDAYKKEFNTLKCDKVLYKNELSTVDILVNQYNQMDTTRIEADSKFLVKKRIFYGVLVLLTGLTMIIILGKKK